MSDHEEVGVVTVFLRNGTDVLLLCRSEAVGSYRGRWGAVAGHAEGDPDAAAREEIAEETGLGDAVALVRRGDPFAVVDEERGTEWRVHPYLFDCERRDVTPNEETATWEWAPPTEILRRETVPELWRSYEAVAPTPEAVRDDATHGSAYLSVRALEVLRDRAAVAVERGAGDWTALADCARDLRAARPGMAALRNRVNRAMRGTRDAADVEASAAEAIAAALSADERAAERAADLLEGARVATCSRSSTVSATLARADPAAVLVAESRPGGEGVGVAESLAGAGTDVTLTTDAAAPGRLREWGADAVLVGADAVQPSGALVNKVGTYPLALAAGRAEIPVYAVCARDKVAPAPVALDEAARDPLYEGDADVATANPLFEATPAGLLAGVVTEAGTLDADGVRAASEAHAALADWERDRAQ